MDNGLYEKCIERREGSRFDRRSQAAEQRHTSHDGHGKFPLGLPESAPRFWPVEIPYVAVVFSALPEAPDRNSRHHDESGDDSGEKHLSDGNPRHDGVENQRQAWSKERSKRSR